MLGRFTRAALMIVGTASLVAPMGAETLTYERVLFPVLVEEPLPGAYGSLWATDAWIANPESVGIEVNGVLWTCYLPECGNVPAFVEPGVTFRPRISAAPGGLQGAFVDVVAGNADQLSFQLRFRDLSRQSETWGTELPVVHEQDFRGDRVTLTDIPLSTGFRQTLRVYELTGVEREAVARVRAYAIHPDHGEPNSIPDELLGEILLPLQFAPLESRVAHPGYAVVSDFSVIIGASPASRIRLVVEPETPDLQLWAFVTVVHNETQHATAITPQ